MTNSTNNLAAEHEEITSSFANSPYIIVSFSDEDPPQKYEIEYKVKGARLQGDGTVEICDSHSVTIAIPFGYPSFPPSCKPVSSIYHPDFDPAAICISDFWTESRSLSELIVRLGLMISGQKYNLENTYNAEATKWYVDNEEKLPFDQVDFSSMPEPILDDEQSATGETEKDTIEQPSFELELDETDDAAAIFGAGDGGNDNAELLDLDELEDIEEQPSFDLDLDGIGDAGEVDIESLSEEETDLSTEPSVPVTPDPPTSTEPEQRTKPTVPTPPDAPPDFLPGELPSSGKSKGSSNTQMAEQFAVEAGKKRNKMIIGGGAVLLVLLLGGGAYFLGMDIKNYSAAEATWQDASDLLKGKQYKAVDKKGKSALVQLEKVLFLKKQESENLSRKINAILRSSEFKGGLAGKVLFEGKYYTAKTIKIIESVKEMKRKGDAVVIIEKWQKALVFYEEAQKILKENREIDQALVDQVNLAAAKVKMNIEVQEGETFLAEGALENAISSFQRAAEIANASTNIKTTKIVNIHRLLDKALVQKFIQDGEGAFSAIDLNKALDNFNQALLLAEKESVSDPVYANNIRQSIRQVKLYQLLDKGKKAIESSQWDEALVSFEDALDYLLASRANSNEMTANEKSIREKIVHIKVNKNRSLSARSRMNNNLKEAVQLEQDIVKIIESSQFRDEPLFKEMKKESQKEISSLRSKIDINEKIDYLKMNYKDIFRSNHSLAVSAKLSYPTVIFVKKSGREQLFNLKCTGRTTTGKISLELNYQYNMDSKKWGLSGG